MNSYRVPRSPAALAGLAVLNLTLAFAAAASAPLVRFLEVGHQGVIFPDAPAFADVEISAGASFRGTLEATLRYGVRQFETDELNVTDRILYRFWAKAGERKRLTLCFPESTTVSPRNKDVVVEIGWRLRNEAGAEVARGKEIAQADKDGPVRVLALTKETSPSYQRAPESAFAEVARYFPFAVVLVSGGDLATLQEAQRQALWDATVIGMTVVVVGPLNALPPPWSGLLSSERVVWTSEAGTEIREAPLFMGRIRRTNLAILPPPKLETTSDPAFLPYALATNPGNLFPHEPATPGPGSFPILSNQLLEARRDIRRRLDTSFAATLLLALIVCLVLWRVSHTVRPMARRTALSVLAALSAFVLCLGAAALRPAGHVRGRAELCLHDPGGQVAVLRSMRVLGGGSGGEEISLTTKLDPTVAPWISRIMGRSSAIRLTVENGDDGVWKVTVPRGAWTGLNVVQAITDRVSPPDSPWESRIRWTGGRPVGQLTFHRAFRRVLLIVNEPDRRKGISAIRLGSPRGEEVLDISRLPKVPLDISRPEESLGEDAYLYENEALSRPMANAGHASLLLLAEDEGESPRCVHVGVLPAESRPPHEQVFRVPGYQEGMEIHALVPSFLDTAKIRYRVQHINRRFDVRDSKPLAAQAATGVTDLILNARTVLVSPEIRMRRDLPGNADSVGFAVEVSE